MKRAIISDVHSNLEALNAVMADIDSQGVEEVYCLGDVVGYGPNPRECIDIIMDRCSTCLLGNHDQGALFDPEGFHPGAEQAIFWTRTQLEDFSFPGSNERWDFLGMLPRTKTDGDFLHVHGSARNPLNEYVFPEDIYDRRKLEKIFVLIPHFCFQGHTHVPGVFTESMEFFSPDEIDFQYQLGNEKVMVNVGSVGQPRDGDPRSSYVILENNLITFRRIQYPLEKTAEKIYRIPDLDDHFGNRLKEGR